jgi:hypothetical protein
MPVDTSTVGAYPMSGANLLEAALENEGVKQVFEVPGEENLDIVKALRRSTIKLVVTGHEQAAAFMAATHGRLTGEAGVCLSTLGARRPQPDDRRYPCARRDSDGRVQRGGPLAESSLNRGEGVRLIAVTNVASPDPRRTCHASHQQS